MKHWGHPPIKTDESMDGKHQNRLTQCTPQVYLWLSRTGVTASGCGIWGVEGKDEEGLNISELNRGDCCQLGLCAMIYASESHALKGCNLEY